MLEEGAEGLLNRRVVLLPTYMMYCQSVHEGTYILEKTKYLFSYPAEKRLNTQSWGGPKG